jgi:hypothetical protein
MDYPASAAIDGNAATPWLADPKDETRTLTLTFNTAIDCSVIRISPAVLPALGPDYLSRPIEVQIEINGKDARRLLMDPDPLHPMRLELEHTTAVKRLDIRILSVAPSVLCPLVGLGEVELFKR